MVVNLLLENASFVFQLLIFLLLVPYLTTQFTLRLVDGLNALVRVQFKLLKLGLKPFLVFFITLGVFSLDDLLGLLRHPVKLDILGPLFEVGDP